MNIRKDEDEWRLAKDTVSNTYTPEDEGKVVDNGTLVAQTSMPDEVTENGTIDTTLYNSVTVEVSGGTPSSDGKTRLYIDLLESDYSVYLSVAFVTSGSIKVDWGDGSEEETFDNNDESEHLHEYDTIDRYTIIVEVLTVRLKPR